MKTTSRWKVSTLETVVAGCEISALYYMGLLTYVAGYVGVVR